MICSRKIYALLLVLLDVLFSTLTDIASSLKSDVLLDLFVICYAALL